MLIAQRLCPALVMLSALFYEVKMKERLVICPYCKDVTRTRVSHRYVSGGKRTGKLTRKVEHCTECNKRRITKK